MAAQKVTVNRTLAGVLAIALLIGGGLIWVFDSWENPLCGAMVRVGLLTGAFWLALPTKDREAAWAHVSPWVAGSVGVALVLVVWRPRVFLLPAVILGGLVLLLRPRGKKRPTRGSPVQGPGPGRASEG
jgi:hypothetical protein